MVSFKGSCRTVLATPPNSLGCPAGFEPCVAGFTGQSLGPLGHGHTKEFGCNVREVATRTGFEPAWDGWTIRCIPICHRAVAAGVGYGTRTRNYGVKVHLPIHLLTRRWRNCPALGNCGL